MQCEDVNFLHHFREEQQLTHPSQCFFFVCDIILPRKISKISTYAVCFLLTFNSLTNLSHNKLINSPLRSSARLN